MGANVGCISIFPMDFYRFVVSFCKQFAGCVSYIICILYYSAFKIGTFRLNAIHNICLLVFMIGMHIKRSEIVIHFFLWNSSLLHRTKFGMKQKTNRDIVHIHIESNFPIGLQYIKIFVYSGKICFKYGKMFSSGKSYTQFRCSFKWILFRFIFIFTYFFVNANFS